LKFLANTKPEFIPGEKGKYSNSNFLLLSVILDEEFKDSIDHASLIQKETSLIHFVLDHTQYIEPQGSPKKFGSGLMPTCTAITILLISHT
jgi:hypothetical protein